MPEAEGLGSTISDVRRPLDHAAEIIVAKDNDLEKLEKEKDKLQQV